MKRTEFINRMTNGDKIFFEFREILSQMIPSLTLQHKQTSSLKLYYKLNK